MSDHTYSDVVPFVAHCVYESEYNKLYDNPDNLDKLYLCFPEATKEDDGEEENLLLDGAIQYGWQYKGTVDAGKRGRLFGGKWVKNSLTVYAINESEYESVGCANMALVSDNKESILEFAKDWNLNISLGIDEDDTVNQTY